MDIYPTAKQFISASEFRKGSSNNRCYSPIQMDKAMLTSLRHVSGYGWKDTASHEYIHLVVLGAQKKGSSLATRGSRQDFEQDWKDELGHQDVHKTFYLSHRQQKSIGTSN